MIRVRDLPWNELSDLLGRFELEVCLVDDGEPIPGSYWGDPEAGLIGEQVHVRSDTPIHSLLHEACHSIVMPAARRQTLHTDAGGEEIEECATCFLQLILADRLEGVGCDRLASDMDEWGYSFRLGSTREWFDRDADDARGWLFANDLIDRSGRPTWGRRR